MNKKDWIIVILVGLIGLLISVFLSGSGKKILIYLVIFVSVMFVSFIINKKRSQQ